MRDFGEEKVVDDVSIRDVVMKSVDSKSKPTDIVGETVTVSSKQGTNIVSTQRTVDQLFQTRQAQTSSWIPNRRPTLASGAEGT